MVDYPYPVYMEIPSRWDNQNLYPLTSSHVSEADSIASITVEIPNDCCSMMDGQLLYLWPWRKFMKAFWPEKA